MNKEVLAQNFALRRAQTPIVRHFPEEPNYASGKVNFREYSPRSPAWRQSKALTWAASAAIVLFSALRCWSSTEMAAVVQLRGKTGIVTFEIPSDYLDPNSAKPNGQVEVVWLALAYPSLRPTGAPGTDTDRSVVIVDVAQSSWGADPEKFVPKKMAIDWLSLPSEHPGLRHFISKVYANWRDSGKSIYRDIYVRDGEPKDFIITCLHEQFNTNTGCESSERVLDNLSLRYHFSPDELNGFYSLRENIRNLIVSLSDKLNKSR